MPKVSVISTIHNGGPYLDAAINSVLNQNYPDYEYVIIDDGSTDNSIELVEQYCKKYSIIKLINAGRIGRVKALNLAIESSSGDYIANLDIDDLAFPSRLESQATLLDQNPLLGVVGGAFQVVNKITNESFTRHPHTEHQKLVKQLAYMIPFSHSVAMFRKSYAKKVGGYKEVANEDLYLWFEMVKNGFQLGATTDILGIHYKHPESYWAKNYTLRQRYRDLAKIQIEIIKELKLSRLYFLTATIRPYFFYLPTPIKTFLKSFLINENNK